MLGNTRGGHQGWGQRTGSRSGWGGYRPYAGLSDRALDQIIQRTARPSRGSAFGGGLEATSRTWQPPTFNFAGGQGHYGAAAVGMNPFLNPGRRSRYEQMAQAMTAPLTAGNVIDYPRSQLGGYAAQNQASVAARRATEQALARQYAGGSHILQSTGYEPNSAWIYGEQPMPWDAFGG